MATPQNPKSNGPGLVGGKLHINRDENLHTHEIVREPARHEKRL